MIMLLGIHVSLIGAAVRVTLAAFLATGSRMEEVE